MAEVIADAGKKPRPEENLNPLSSKGRLKFSSFALSLGAIVLFNLVVWAALRSQLIPARLSLDRDRVLGLYVIWLIFATLGFTAVTNTFIKRWAHVLRSHNLSSALKSLIRFSLLSPLLAYPLTLVTFLFFPGSRLLDVKAGGSKAINLGLLLGSFAFSIAVASFVPSSLFGIERIDFRASTQPVAAVQKIPVQFPRPLVLKPLLATATPGLRYLFWMGSDVYRTRLLSTAVSDPESPLCQERLGFLGIEVRDCYFSNLRKMATVAPLVSPYFALYFESLYRQEVGAGFKAELDDKLAERDRKLNADPTYVSGDGSTMRQGFVFSLLMLSNQLELLEASPMFVERIHFLSPPALLHAYGSPEFPFVEASQDIQRVGLLQKLMPIFEFQLAGIQKFLDDQGRTLGVEEVTIAREVDDIRRRIDAVKRDPLLIGNK